MRVSSIVPGLSAAALLLQLLAAPAQAERPAARPGKAKAVRAEAGHSYRHRAELRAFAAEVATRHDWDASWVQAQLADARRLPRVAQLIMPPAVGAAKNWAAYHDRFVEPRRIQAGLDFWQTHQDTLQRAEDRFGVPAAVVVGIIGVETFYGRITGNHRVIDALATLAFDFPAGRSDRSAYFRGELEEFFVLCAREGLDPQAVKGSFAGAMGLPQFMPGSVNRWAVDHDGDGHVDLQSSAADAVGSVARYLQVHGWQTGLDTHHAVAVPVDAANRALLLGPDIVPTFSAAQFAERGAVLGDAGRAHAGPLALVELHNGELAPSYVAGTQNFYAVTRYNQSSYYALAVIELGRAVAVARAAR